MQTLRSWRHRLTAIYSQLVYLIKYLSALSKFLWRKTFPYLKKFHINAFPNSRLKDFNAVDITLKFSSEFVLLTLAVLVALWNFYFLGSGKTYSDKSHVARLIAAHPELNQKLYAKMSVINTVVLSQNLVVLAAQAEEAVSLSPTVYTQEDPSSALIFNNDTIVQPNPDSVQQLLAKQIRVYQTKDGDTLKSIALENDISVNTIVWPNKLTSSTIKPGWFLVILPTDGILVKASDNDTLPDIAHKYNPEKYNANAQTREDSADKLLEKIISYNGLDGAEDITGGDILIVPGGVVPIPPAPKPQSRNDSKINGKGIVTPEDADYGTGHRFPWGYCTWYVASKVHVSWGGNAKSWLANAKATGATITSHAVPGSIVVTTDSRRFGHVALVESISESGFMVSEMNFEKFGKVDKRFIPNGSKTVRGFIIP